MTDDVIGRESELAILDRFLDSIPSGPGAVLLSGEAGIGKTTVWKAGLDGALRRRYRTLSCGPVEAETRLSYAALGDLLEPVLDETLPTLPEPQRRALEVALLRAPSSGARANQRAVSLAVLGCLRSVASTGPVVVAIDDIQWMDLPSVRVLQFVVRRFKGEPVGLMCAVRGADAAEDPLGAAAAVPEDRVHRVHVGPLSVDAIERVIRDTVADGFARTTLLRLHETSGGNPFFAQEIGRALLRRGGDVAAGERPPIPERLQELVEDRLEGLPAETIEALEVVSAAAAPTLDAIAATTDPSGIERGLDPALANGVVEVVGDRLRFTHPLLASAVYQRMPSARRRELHARLATIVRDPEERARHLALSVDGPDAAVALALDEAALLASSRGAPQSAAELWEMARRATPRDRREDLVRRTHHAGVAHYECGDTTVARSALEQAVDLSTAGPARARVLLDPGQALAETEGWRAAWAVFEAARGEAGDDRMLRARVEQNLGYVWLFRGDLGASERHARAALELAEELQDPRIMAEAFQAYPFVAFLLGRGVDQELLDRGVALEGHMEGEFKSQVLRASFAVGQLLKFTDRLDEARRTFTRLLGDAAAHGVETPIPQFRYHLAQLECWAGNWEAAMEHARESRAAAQRSRMGPLSAEGHFAVGLVEAHLGRADAARLEALEGLRLAEAAGEIFLVIPNLSVLGFLELSLGRPAEADAYLSRAVELERTMGVREPAYFRVVPDEVEALVALGRLDEAEALLAPFEEAGTDTGRAWTIATGARCRALMLAARGDLAGASTAADEAVRQHDRLPIPFELGRTLLVRGTVERRAKRKREARDTLTKALEVFDGLGATLWADKTRAELARIGGRALSSLDLTPTEDRVAALVAAGGTNREVADALFVSVHTVEANLKRIYRKLGVRSRTELASKFRSDTSGTTSSFGSHGRR
ncbi:MAG TPA: AAA family ATPase [Actinomycetota bacterium]|nr:AAA family ATPase [Actinomycetota bacterium]